MDTHSASPSEMEEGLVNDGGSEVDLIGDEMSVEPLYLKENMLDFTRQVYGLLSFFLLVTVTVAAGVYTHAPQDRYLKKNFTSGSSPAIIAISLALACVNGYVAMSRDVTSLPSLSAHLFMVFAAVAVGVGIGFAALVTNAPWMILAFGLLMLVTIGIAVIVWCVKSDHLTGWTPHLCSTVLVAIVLCAVASALCLMPSFRDIMQLSLDSVKVFLVLSGLGTWLHSWYWMKVIQRAFGAPLWPKWLEGAKSGSRHWDGCSKSIWALYCAPQLPFAFDAAALLYGGSMFMLPLLDAVYLLWCGAWELLFRAAEAVDHCHSCCDCRTWVARCQRVLCCMSLA